MTKFDESTPERQPATADGGERAQHKGGAAQPDFSSYSPFRVPEPGQAAAASEQARNLGKVADASPAAGSDAQKPAPERKPDAAGAVQKDGSWKNFQQNDSIEAEAAPFQKWNRADQPIPPIGQILARDSNNDPAMENAVKSALQRQAGGDKTRIGDLIVDEVGKAGGDKAAARASVEKAFGEQKNMQYDYAGQAASKVFGKDFESGHASDVDAAARELAKMPQGKMMDALKVAPELWNMLPAFDKESPGAPAAVIRKAGEIAQLKTPAEREAAVEKIRKEMKDMPMHP